MSYRPIFLTLFFLTAAFILGTSSLRSEEASPTDLLQWALNQPTSTIQISRLSKSYPLIKQALRIGSFEAVNMAIKSRSDWSLKEVQREKWDQWITLTQNEGISVTDWDKVFSELSQEDRFAIFLMQGSDSIVSYGRLRDNVELSPMFFLPYPIELSAKDYTEAFKAILNRQAGSASWSPIEHRITYQNKALEIRVKAIAKSLENNQDLKRLQSAFAVLDNKDQEPFAVDTNTARTDSRLEGIDFIVKEIYVRILKRVASNPAFEIVAELSEGALSDMMSHAVRAALFGKPMSEDSPRVQLSPTTLPDTFIGICLASKAWFEGSYTQSIPVVNTPLIQIHALKVNGAVERSKDTRYICGSQKYQLAFQRSTVKGKLPRPTSIELQNSDEEIRAFASLALIPQVDAVQVMALKLFMRSQGYRVAEHKYITDIKTEFEEAINAAHIYIPLTNEPNSTTMRSGFKGGQKIAFTKNGAKRIRFEVFLPPLSGTDTPVEEPQSLVAEDVERIFAKRRASGSGQLLVINLWCRSAGSIPVWLTHYAQSLQDGELEKKNLDLPLIIGAEGGFSGESIASAVETLGYPLAVIETVAAGGKLMDIQSQLEQPNKIGKFYTKLGFSKHYESFRPAYSWAHQYDRWYELGNQLKFELKPIQP